MNESDLPESELRAVIKDLELARREVTDSGVQRYIDERLKQLREQLEKK
jgi:hypothetical protein